MWTEHVFDPSNRRNFFRKLGLTSAAIGAAAAGARAQSSPSPSPTVADADILNFALNLEYLEAECYTVATTGMTLSQTGIDTTGTGNSGATTGGGKVSFTDPTIQAVAQALAADERKHIIFLKTALALIGAQSIAKPALNLNALGFGFGTQSEFLALARVFEDIGLSAYAAAASLIQSKDVLDSASRILAIEAEHAGNLRLLIAQNGISTTAVDGADHLPPPSGLFYFSTNNNGLSEVRTPSQVLYLAYGAANAGSGGFFPNGVNGSINMSAGSGATGGPLATLTASPNPIPASGGALGTTTISWNAPSAQVIQLRIGGPSGALFFEGSNSGSAQTGAWVGDGLTVYLQDVTGGRRLTPDNTLAILVLHVHGV